MDNGGIGKPGIVLGDHNIFPAIKVHIRRDRTPSKSDASGFGRFGSVFKNIVALIFKQHIIWVERRTLIDFIKIATDHFGRHRMADIREIKIDQPVFIKVSGGNPQLGKRRLTGCLSAALGGVPVFFIHLHKTGILGDNQIAMGVLIGIGKNRGEAIMLVPQTIF